MQTEEPYRFLLVEDQTLLRELLQSHLQSAYPKSRVVAVTRKADLPKISEIRQFTLSIVDLELPDGNAFDWILEASKQPCQPRILLLTSLKEDFVLYKTLHSSIQGFVHKSDGTSVLHEAIHAVVSGRAYFSHTLQVMRSRMASDSHFFHKVLSEREQEVLQYLGQGLRNEDVAQVLALSVSTVADYRKNIMAKLGIHSQVDLVRYAVQKGFSRI